LDWDFQRRASQKPNKMGVYDYIAKGELIGLNLKIIESKNQDLVGLQGKVIDETKNMLTIETKKGIKKIIKSEIKMRLNVKGKEFDVDGKILVRRPEDRIKKVRGLK